MRPPLKTSGHMRSHAVVAVRVFAFLETLLVGCVFVRFWPRDFRDSQGEFLWTILVIPCMIQLFGWFGLYESHRVEGRLGLLRRVLSAHLTAFVVLGLVLGLLPNHTPYIYLLQFLSVSALVMAAERSVLHGALQLLRRRGLDTRNVCVIGDWERAQDLARRFREHPEWGLRITCVGAADQNRNFRLYPSGEALQGDMEQVLRLHVVDEVVIAAAPEDLPRQSEVFHLCHQYGLLARVVLDIGVRPLPEPSVEDLCGTVSLAVRRHVRSDFALLAKQVIDIILALGLFILLMPVLLLVALLVKLSSPGPVIFRQKRVGLHGRTFRIYKFRTMLDGAESNLQSVACRNITGGPVFKDPKDCRITPFGHVLRRFSIDELPQLLNVLKGEMSLVGPRPLPVHEASAIVGEYRRRFSMRPGITCLWQINGRSNIDYSTWMKYDLQYVDGWSLWLDAKVLLRTIPVVFSGDGAY
jgi:exopolysaccharide biosynthesis polyprenyl glycosylphosphotransferase